MKVSANLTPQRFLEILISTYMKGQENEINVKQIVEEIKRQFLSNM